MVLDPHDLVVAIGGLFGLGGGYAAGKPIGALLLQEMIDRRKVRDEQERKRTDALEAMARDQERTAQALETIAAHVDRTNQRLERVERHLKIPLPAEHVDPEPPPPPARTVSGTHRAPLASSPV